MNPEEHRPWERLSELMERQDTAGIEAFWRKLPPEEVSRVLDRLSAEQKTLLLHTVDPEYAAVLVEHVPEPQAADVIEKLSVEEAAAILHELPSNEQADLLIEIQPREARAILEAMPPSEAENVRDLIQYPNDVAGGLMIKEFLAYREDLTVEAVIDDLRRIRESYQNFNVLYVYATDREGRLAGVLRLRHLLLSGADELLKDLIHEPIAVQATASLRELEAVFERYSFLALPVVAEPSRLVGVVQRSAVMSAVNEQSEDAYRSSQGIVRGEELRSMPALVRSGRRLSWLSLNIFLNVIAASVIAFYEDTLASVIALAVFLPIVSDMSGCSGNQAVAVSVREMALGILRPGDALRVWRQEVLVGALNGLALGALIAAVAIAWRGNVYLGLVVGSALALNTLIAVSIGGLVPLLVKRLGKDPALASGPILTTLTDMFGFLLILGLATLCLPWIRGA